MFMRFFTSFLTILTFVLLSDVVKAQTLPKELLVNSVSGCQSSSNSIVSHQVSPSKIIQTTLSYTGPVCSGPLTIENTEFMIAHVASTNIGVGEFDATLVVINNGARYEVTLSRIENRYDIMAFPDPKNVRSKQWGGTSFVWDGTKKLTSRYFTNRAVLGEKCFSSDVFSPDLNSYKVSISIFPTHLFVEKYWFKENNCHGTNVSVRDHTNFLVMSAVPEGTTESIVTKSGDKLEITKSNGKWILSGLPILEGHYVAPPFNKYSLLGSSENDPNAWKTVDPLAVPNE